MAQIALFHPDLGVRRGVTDAAERLRAPGHDVRIVDQYDGRTFATHEEASAFVESVGFPALMGRAVEGVAGLEPGFVAVGFSNGGGMAQYVATQVPVAGVAMLSGALDLAMLGPVQWPAGVPAQIHYTVDDPLRNEAWVQAAADAVTRAGGEVERFDYPGAAHLFTDASRPDEYDPDATELLFERLLAFVARVG